METTLATVIAVSPESVLVSVENQAACPRCAAGKGCGAGIFTSNTKERRLQVPLSPDLKVREGDRVRLSLGSSHLLKATFLAYGLPLFGLVAATGTGWLLFGPLSDATAIVFAVAGLLTGVIVGRRHLQRDHCLMHFVPTIAEHVGTRRRITINRQ